MKLIIVAALAVFFVSCQSKGTVNEIKQRYVSRTFEWVTPTQAQDSALRSDYASGYFELIPSAETVNLRKVDSIYKIELTWPQAIEMGKHDGSGIIFIIGLVIFVGGIILAIIKFQAGTRSAGDHSVLAWVLIPLVGAAIAGGAYGWDKWNTDREIKKSDYYHYLKTDGNLDAFWKTEPEIY